MSKFQEETPEFWFHTSQQSESGDRNYIENFMIKYKKEEKNYRDYILQLIYLSAYS